MTSQMKVDRMYIMSLVRNIPLLLRLTGRSANAAYDSYYIVLTSNTELSFKEVDAKFWGSHLTPTEDFVIVEYGLVYE